MIDMRRHLKYLIYNKTKTSLLRIRKAHLDTNIKLPQKRIWAVLRCEKTAFPGTSLAAKKVKSEIIKIRVDANGW